jgi:hypothetical protein
MGGRMSHVICRGPVCSQKSDMRMKIQKRNNLWSASEDYTVSYTFSSS